VERYINLRVIRKILVCFRNVGLKAFKEQAINRQHWHRLSLSIIDQILNDRRLKGKNGKELLALQTSEEEPLECLLHILKKEHIILERRYGNGYDKALRVTRCAREMC
jgi:hypothetical protein